MKNRNERNIEHGQMILRSESEKEVEGSDHATLRATTKLSRHYKSYCRMTLSEALLALRGLLASLEAPGVGMICSRG
jgi:hypothetical protein